MQQHGNMVHGDSAINAMKFSPPDHSKKPQINPTFSWFYFHMTIISQSLGHPKLSLVLIQIYMRKTIWIYQCHQPAMTGNGLNPNLANQLIGLRETLQENPIFNGKIDGFL